jgi:hypothetical protein
VPGAKLSLIDAAIAIAVVIAQAILGAEIGAIAVVIAQAILGAEIGAVAVLIAQAIIILVVQAILVAIGLGGAGDRCGWPALTAALAAAPVGRSLARRI